jgi:hypothetical protein
VIVGEWVIVLPCSVECRTGKGKPKEQSERLIEVESQTEKTKQLITKDEYRPDRRKESRGTNE